MVCSVTLWFEPISRQSEIALYTLNKSMEVAYNMALRREWPVKVPKGECWLVGVALALICYHHANCPQAIRQSYLSLLDRMLKDV
jgi:hypothetical protein